MIREKLVGSKINRWTILSYDKEKRLFTCRCECGQIRSIHDTNLTRNKSKSCGCYRTEEKKRSCPLHIYAGTKIYFAYRNMINRCYNKKVDSYPTYGARGITVCKRWRDGFKYFLEDMLPTYKEGLSIDRIDFRGNYEPKNCRWATMKEQANNTSHSKNITFKGQTKTLKQWSEKLGINYSSLQTRLRAGWSVEKTFTEPIKVYQ